MSVGKNPKTKEIFERFHGKIEEVLEAKFEMSYNTLDDITMITFGSVKNASNFKMTIYEENGSKYVPNTLIKIDKCTLKINYFEVYPTKVGLGTKLFEELLNLISGVQIKRIVAIPESDGAKIFWEKNNFIAFGDYDTQLYLDI